LGLHGQAANTGRVGCQTAVVRGGRVARFDKQSCSTREDQQGRLLSRAAASNAGALSSRTANSANEVELTIGMPRLVRRRTLQPLARLGRSMADARQAHPGSGNDRINSLRGRSRNG